MKSILLPRVITANRGDLASRYLLLETLSNYSEIFPVVFRYRSKDIPDDLKGLQFPYGKGRNLIPPRKAWKTWLQTKTVFWAVGIDLQDESSLAKLFYLWLMFKWLHISGKRIWMLYQGAGPLRTKTGNKIAQQVLKHVDIFLARDPQTTQIITSLSPHTHCFTGHDAIFLPGKNRAVAPVPITDQDILAVFATKAPVIGINVRLWFHLNSALIPYQFSRTKHVQRASKRMNVLLATMADIIHTLRKTYGARIVLISAYEPNIEPWEDDLPWLNTIKNKWFSSDPEVMVFDKPLTMPDYFSLMSHFSLVVSMRLHTSLIALRFGVPAINLSYTTKGKAIMQHLGLDNNVFDLEDFLRFPKVVEERIQNILAQKDAEAHKVQQAVEQAIVENTSILEQLLEEQF